MVHEITTETFPQEVANQEGNVIIDFWAPWCGPCKVVEPVVEEVSEQLTDIKFVKVNVDDNPSVASLFGIRSIPTFVLLSGGKPVSAITGTRSKEDFTEWVIKHVK